MNRSALFEVSGETLIQSKKQPLYEYVPNDVDYPYEYNISLRAYDGVYYSDPYNVTIMVRMSVKRSVCFEWNGVYGSGMCTGTYICDGTMIYLFVRQVTDPHNNHLPCCLPHLCNNTDPVPPIPAFSVDEGTYGFNGSSHPLNFQLACYDEDGDHINYTLTNVGVTGGFQLNSRNGRFLLGKSWIEEAFYPQI